MKKILIVIFAVLLIFAVCKSKQSEIITHFDIDFAQLYPTPMPGEVRYSGELKAAREYYINDSVKFLVRCNFFDAKRNCLSDEDKNKENKRISDNGYDLYVTKAWEYKGEGEKIYWDEVLLLLTEQGFENFIINSDYGYFFEFVHNGDYSPACFSECKKYDSKVIE